MKLQRMQERVEVALVLDNCYNEDEIVNIWQFDQVWPSTALGFNRAGGNTINGALTTVVLTINGRVDVYFGTKIAYAKTMSEVLMEDIRKCRMESVMNASKYDKYD